MRSIRIGLLAIFCPLLGYSQDMMPAVVNLSGFDATINNQLVTSSVGEPLITTLLSEDIILTQGFLQPEILPCLNVEFSYYPNPAPEEITLEVSGCEVQIESIQLFDLWGRLIPSVKLGKNNKIKLHGLSQGLYLIEVQLSNGASHAIKIIKVD